MKSLYACCVNSEKCPKKQRSVRQKVWGLERLMHTAKWLFVNDFSHRYRSIEMCRTHTISTRHSHLVEYSSRSCCFFCCCKEGRILESLKRQQVYSVWTVRRRTARSEWRPKFGFQIINFAFKWSPCRQCTTVYSDCECMCSVSNAIVTDERSRKISSHQASRSGEECCLLGE